MKSPMTFSSSGYGHRHVPADKEEHPGKIEDTVVMAKARRMEDTNLLSAHFAAWHQNHSV